MSKEKVTVQVAAKALNVTPKTIHRWVKLGTLSKVKEGNRAYIPMDEIRALRQEHGVTEKSDVFKNFPEMEPDSNIVPVKRDHYEGLLTRLGQLEAKQELLLEYKTSLEKKDRDIAETKTALSETKEKVLAQNKILREAGDRIRELQAEVKRSKTPWWRRWFGK